MAPVLLSVVAVVGTAGSAQAAVTITTDSTPVAEGTAATVTVTRSQSLSLSAAEVRLRITGNGDAPAACPQDVQASAGNACEVTVSIDSALTGNQSKEVSLPTTQDTIDEADEEGFKVDIVSVTNDTTGTPSSANLTIKDDDARPTLSIGDATSVVEGDRPGAVLEFPVTLSAASGLPVTATVALGGTATPATDVTPDGFKDTFTIPAGTKTATLKLAVVPDDLDEPDEDATVTLSDLTNADAGTPPALAAKGTILNDDVPAISVADVVGSEGTGAARTPFAFELKLSNPSTRTVAVTASTSDLQAKAGQDYDATTQRVTFTPGTIAQTVTVGVIADAVKEDAEAFVLNLSDPANATLAVQGALGGISDDDKPTTGAGGSGTAIPGTGTGTGGNGTNGVSTGRLRLTKLTFARPSSVSGTLECPAASRGCKGRVTLFTVPARRSKVKLLRRELKLGSIAFDVAAGTSQKLKLRVKASALQAIKRGKQVSVKAFAVSRNPAGEVSTADAKGVVRP